MARVAAGAAVRFVVLGAARDRALVVDEPGHDAHVGTVIEPV